MSVKSTLLVAFLTSTIAQAQPTWNHAPHPRLYLNPAKISALKNGLQTTYSQIWPNLQKQADEIAATHPPTYSETRDLSGDELWWEMDVGTRLPYLALAYVATGKKQYFESAKEWTLMACSYPHWGMGPRDGGDLSAGFMLVGVGLVYDWLYSELDPASRETIRRTLIERSRLMFQQSGKQAWRNQYLQNHLWVSLDGLATGAAALLDDPEAAGEAATWMAVCLDKFRRTEALLGADGASHEGVTYWSLGVDGLLRFWDLSKNLLGEDVTSKWWANTGYYRLYLSLPRNAWTPENNSVDFADSTRRDWVGPDYLLRRLAAINHDGYIQWLAQQSQPISNCGRFGSCWLNAIWHDPALAAQAPTPLPTMRHFADMGIVSSRTDWSGTESLLAFKCGPGLGHFATDRLDYDAGSGHVHPDANHFVLFGNGEWLIRDDGYRFKTSENHNTLLVDGKGQWGDNAPGSTRQVYGRAIPPGMWFTAMDQIRLKLHPRVTKATSMPDVDTMVGDATESYPKELGLRRFVRQVVFLKPNIVIVADDIETDVPHDLELRFHPQFPGAADPSGGYVSRGKKAVLRVTPLTNDAVQIVADYLPAKDMLTPAKAEGLDKLEDPKKMYTVQLKSRQTSWRNVVAFTWAPAGQTPAQVTLDKKGDSWTIRSVGRAVSLPNPKNAN